MASKQIVVVGLGRFGRSLAQTLTDLGHEVMALDKDSDSVDEVSEFATQAIQLDATDEDALRGVGIGDFEIGAVAIGTDVKSSILVTMLLKTLGVKTVISKAQDELHGAILAKVGADRVVYPERETAIRVAHSLSVSELTDYLEVTPGYGVAKLMIPKTRNGATLGQLDLKGRFGVTPLMLYSHEEVIINPDRSQHLGEGDVLIVAGPDDSLEKLRTS